MTKNLEIGDHVRASVYNDEGNICEGTGVILGKDRIAGVTSYKIRFDREIDDLPDWITTSGWWVSEQSVSIRCRLNRGRK